MLTFLIELELKNSSRLFSLLVAKSAPWSQAFLAEMLETEDKNCEPPSIGLPLSLISHYFLLLKYLEGGGGGWYIIIN